MIRAPSASSPEAVQRHLDALAKPPGSLGRLEETAVRLACIVGDPPPPLKDRLVVVMAGDHGVARRGVSAYPPAVTREMCLNMAAGGAAISVLARAVGARVTVVDIGVAGEKPVGNGVLHRRVRAGTRDLSEGAALTSAEVGRALEVGASVVRESAPPPGVLVLGEMGIGNTTAASALTAALTGAPVEQVVGAGTGVSDAARRRKVKAIRAGVSRIDAFRTPIPGAPCDVAVAVAAGHRPAHPLREHALTALAEVGGLEIAGLAGVALEGARRGLPVILDGFISSVAGLAAVRIEPETSHYLFASHRSTEPGHAFILDELGLQPLLDLDLRLGEGTGGALAIPLLEAAGALLREMATFDGAGVSGPLDPG